MSAASRDQLAEARRVLASAEAELRNLRRAETTARQTVCRSRRSAWAALSPRQRMEVALVYYVTGQMMYAIECIRQRLKRRKGAAALAGDDDLAQQVTAALCQEDMRRAQAAAVEAPEGSAASFRAGLFVAEICLRQWLVAQNARGVAPSTGRMALQLRGFWPAQLCRVRVRKWLLRIRHRRVSQSTWAFCFRRRWGIKWGRMPARGAVAPATQMQRAPS